MKSGRLLGLAFAGLLAMWGCSNPMVSGGEGTLTLSFQDSTRTLLPALDMDIAEYKVVMTKGATQITKTVGTGGVLTQTLTEGTWSIQADAYNADATPVKIGSGTASVQVVAGQGANAAVKVVPLTGLGTVNFTVDWTGLTLTSPSVTATLVSQATGQTSNLSFGVSGTKATLVKNDLSAGYYTLNLQLKDGATVKGPIQIHAVRVVAGTSTTASFIYSPEGSTGNVSVQVVVDLQLPMNVSISGVAATVQAGQSVVASASCDETGVTWSWYLNGALQASTASSITIPSASLVLGNTYRLDAFAQKGERVSSGFVSFTVVDEVVPSTASANPGSCEFTTDGLDVTLYAANPSGGEYKVNTGTWIAYTSGFILKDLGKGLTDGQKVTLSLKNGTAVPVYTYTRKVLATGNPPVITLTPAGTFADGTTKAVAITITDDPVAGATTAASYTRNAGTSQAISNNSASFTVDATTTVVVTATNTAGTSTATATYTEEGAKTSFSWDNATVYFAITDRFNNGDTTNDTSYGRLKVDGTGKNIGTFHGGDLKGMKAKVDSNYFSDLGVNAIWITAPYEQIHGFVGGGTGDFAHYAYHGYYALDFTNIDANMGTRADMKAFVDAAHAKGIRVVLDIVMNHAGYADMKSMKDMGFGGTRQGLPDTWTPVSGQNWHSYHDIYIDYKSTDKADAWLKWWGKDWLRVGSQTDSSDYIIGYPDKMPAPGSDPLRGNYAGLPDFKTESDLSVGLSTYLQNKSTYGGAFAAGYPKTGTKKVRDWLSDWLAQWVREYGIDGFRVDTAKHVERSTWALLKTKSVQALKDWRAANPTDTAASWTDDFWTTGEVFDQGMSGEYADYHVTGQFDSLINFGFMGVARGGNFGTAASTFSSYASSINANKTNKWNYLSFMNNHDKGSLYNGGADGQKKAGTILLLAPGGVQIFYGDEYGRVNGDGGSDPDQGSRSDFNWSTASTQLADSNSVLKHWQKVGQFRRNHLSVGGGDHAGITTSSGTAFTRVWNDAKVQDKVAVVMGASGTVSVTVSSIWTNGTQVQNFYDGTTAAVTNGTVSFSAGTNGVILLEEVK